MVGAVAVANNMNHVAYVEGVNPDGTVTVSEMNWNWQAGVLNQRVAQSSDFTYIY